MKSLTAGILAAALLLLSSIASFAADKAGKSESDPISGVTAYTGVVSKVRELPPAGKSKGNKNIELVIDLQDGKTVTIIQEEDDEYAVGDAVRVYKDEKGKVLVHQ